MINQVILSCNEDPTYSEFWPVVAPIYKAMGFTPHLAFLSNKDEFDPMVQEFAKHGKVTIFRPLPDIPEFGQAKMIRFILASMQKDDVCYIDDIDLFPLSKTFITDKTDQRPAGVLLCVGGEVYGFNGCYPISQMTGEGWLWKKFINPGNVSYDIILRSFKDKAFYDHRENIMIPVNKDERGGFVNDMYFSDERLLKRLIVENPVPKLELQRGYSNHLESTIDRQTFQNGEWEFSVEKLFTHGYFNAHCIRPYGLHKEKFLPLIQYIKENYGTK